MLVDIEPLLKKCKEIYNSRTPFAASLIIREMEKAKVVDAEEVKRGRWLSIGFGEYWCSVCDTNGEDVLDKRGLPHWKHCPNCGTKMDGGNK